MVRRVLWDFGVFGNRAKVSLVLNSGLGATVTWSSGPGIKACHLLVGSLSQDVSTP